MVSGRRGIERSGKRNGEMRMKMARTMQKIFVSYEGKTWKAHA